MNWNWKKKEPFLIKNSNFNIFWELLFYIYKIYKKEKIFYILKPSWMATTPNVRFSYLTLVKPASYNISPNASCKRMKIFINICKNKKIFNTFFQTTKLTMFFFLQLFKYLDSSHQQPQALEGNPLFVHYHNDICRHS